MNETSWDPLNGTSTLLAVHQDPTGYAPVGGGGIGAGDQFLVTEDSIQVLDVQIVRIAVHALSHTLLLSHAWGFFLFLF